MRSLAVVLILVASIFLAGCTSDDDDLGLAGGIPSGSGEGDEEVDEDARLTATGQKPAQWNVGHYWSYRTSFGTDFTLVVTEDQGEDWYLDTTGVDSAWFNARDPISYLGDVRKNDLAGSQGSDRVQYFDFPLEEGKEWTTPWDGGERRIVTVEANETFRFKAYEDEDLVVEYDYDPEVGWFTEVAFYEGEDGQESFSFSLSDHQTGWTGDVVRWDAERFASGSAQGGIVGGSFTAEGYEELWLSLYFHCEGDELFPASSLTLFSTIPGQPIALGLDECMDEEVTLEIPDPEGTWLYQATTTTAFDDSGVLVFEIWGRTLETIDVA